MAPTILPQDAQSSFAVSNAKTSVITKPHPGYVVQLASGVSPLASFGATQYSTSSAAALAAATNPDKLGTGQSAGHIALGRHLTATVTQYRMSSASENAASISWTQSQWHITVTNYSGGTVPTAVAKEVVADFKGVSLPVPQTEGALFVNLGGSGGLRVNMQWQKGVDEYFVDVHNTATDPINAAIQITASMETYSS
ncbi:hypothetical protein [Sulfobacillus harzensis]|uniref:Uncharacterized protein n=1 Tax=Sulfobacillus harzensis TaxID=2729629 RepID=A0A7Y0L5P1_9FIRM|nr:hypothetical protein [Sulfobacillus harzensis]NMP23518.1 hypothetical protein [Sulfobacillus harzensis]